MTQASSICLDRKGIDLMGNELCMPLLNLDYGLKICEIDGEMCLRLERKNNLEFHNMFSLLESCAKKAKELKLGKITKEEYDHWRYHYPDLETFGFTQHIPTGIDFEEEEDIPLSALLR